MNIVAQRDRYKSFLLPLATFYRIAYIGVMDFDLKEWRKALRPKISQTKLSQLLGVHRASVIRWEAGEEPIWPEMLKRACRDIERERSQA